MSKTSMKKVIAARVGGKDIPLTEWIRNSPGLASAASKTVRTDMPIKHDKKGNREITTPDINNAKMLSEKMSQSIIDSRTTLSLLPDLEIGAQLFLASVLSSKDSLSTEIIYNVAQGLLPSDLTGQCTGIIRDYFEQDYKIKNHVTQMVWDQMIAAGAYVVAVLPENAIDEMINGNRTISNESLGDLISSNGRIRQLGVLGPLIKDRPDEVKRRVSVEDILDGGMHVDVNSIDEEIGLQLDFDGVKQDTYLTVTDNLNVLRLPLLHRQVRERNVRAAVHGLRPGVGMESGDTNRNGFKDRINDVQAESLFYKHRNYGYVPMASVKPQNQLNRYSVGEPLVWHLPAEACIPAHAAGNPKEHFGVFVLLDNEGYPVRRVDGEDEYSRMQARMNTTAPFSSAMLNKVNKQMYGQDINAGTQNNQQIYNNAVQAFADFVERDLLERLRNGFGKNAGIDLGRNDDIYRVMFARSMKQQHTQILFIPSEYVTYMAFDYDGNGMGVSLLEKNKIVNTIRIMTMFADVMAGLKNSIGRTNVQVRLDPRDPDPMGTREKIMHEIARSRISSFPLGANTVAEMVDGIQQAGIEIHVTGHKDLPDMDVEFSEKNSNYTHTDSDLKEQLRRLSLMTTYATPEMVDTSLQPDFATVFTETNLMTAKRAMQVQDDFTPNLSKHARQVVMASRKLFGGIAKAINDKYDDLKKYLKENNILTTGHYISESMLSPEELAKIRQKEQQGEIPEFSDDILNRVRMVVVDRLTRELIDSLELTLPRPNAISLSKQMEGFKAHGEAVKDLLDVFFDSNAYGTNVLGEASSQLDTVKATLHSMFMRKYAAENGILPEVLAVTATDGKGMIDPDLIAGLKDHNEASTELIYQVMKALNDNKKKADKKFEKLGLTEGEGGFSSDTGNSDDTGGGGGDDFGFDLDGEPGGEPGAEGGEPGAEGQEPGTEEPEGEGNAAGENETGGEPNANEGGEPEEPQQ